MQEMEVWPSDVGLRGQASNHPVLRWLKTVVVSDREKARLIASGGDQEDVPEAFVREIGWAFAVEASKSRADGIEIGGPEFSFETNLAGARVLARWCPA